jgi:hypothetical protein
MNHILIVGGTGHVGRLIATRILAAGTASLRLGGRDMTKATHLARKLGCTATRVDLHDPASWDKALMGIDTVITCIDAPDADFARAVLKRGLRYIDISATDAVLRRIEDLDPLARENGGLAVLSVGLAPGLSTLLAEAACVGFDSVDLLHIHVLLSGGDAHGAAAIDWTLDNLRDLSPREIERLRPGSDMQDDFPAALSIPFDFADQHVLRRQGHSTASTRLALISPLITRSSLRLMAALARRPLGRRLLHWSLSHLRIGSDRAAVAVQLHGRIEGQDVEHWHLLDGQREAEITAAVAVFVTLALEERTDCGVYHINELWTLDDLAPLLRDEGISLFPTET